MPVGRAILGPVANIKMQHLRHLFNYSHAALFVFASASESTSLISPAYLPSVARFILRFVSADG